MNSRADPNLLNDAQRVSYGRILAISAPLIAQQLSYTIMTMADRLFLAKFDTGQFTAAAPAAGVGYAVGSFFLGVVWFVGNLCAQYFGAHRREKLGAAVWQGVWFAAGSSLLLLALLPVFEALFGIFKHAPEILNYEKIYLRFMIITAVFNLFSGALAGFFIGTGKTNRVMYASLVANIVNIGLDYVLIFGKLGFPAMGITGAGLATAIGGGANFLTLLICYISSGREHRDLLKPVFEPLMMKRLIKFGAPAALQTFIDASGFALQMLFIGMLGAIPLAAANVAYSLQNFAYTPMMAIANGGAIIVGQERGANRLHNVSRVIIRTVIIAALLNACLLPIFELLPVQLASLFTNKENPEHIASIIGMAKPLLRIVGIWIVIDAFYNVFMQSLKALGDTVFIMICFVVFIPLTVVLPAYLITHVIPQGPWSINLFFFSTVLFVFCLFLSTMIRFLSGKWKRFNVIEERSFS